MREIEPDKLDIKVEDETLHEAPTVIDLPKSSITGTDKSEQKKSGGSTIEKTIAPATPVLPYRRRNVGLPKPVLILIITLTMLLILSGVALIIFTETVQYRTTLRGITTTALRTTRNAQGTTHAQEQGTSNALNTAQANIEASATARADEQGQATATVEQATATAQALSAFYIQATNGNPIFDDPLSDNNGAGKWDEGSSDENTGCFFEDDGYHIREAHNGNLQPCIAQSSRYSSFAYQAHIQFTRGSQGQAGLLFRIGSNDQTGYFFSVSTDGSYTLESYSGASQGHVLAQGVSASLVRGIEQDNVLTAIANSTELSLYINGDYVASVTDTRLSAGKIGLGVVSHNGAVDVIFSDAQIWLLSQAGSQTTPAYYQTPTASYYQTPDYNGTATPQATVTATATASPTSTAIP